MSNRIQDAKLQPLSKVDRLRQDAEQAARIRRLTTHPDVIALRVEAIRTQVDRLLWTGIVLGLAFTMVNVQLFVANTAAVWSLPWCAAWVFDPMVSIVLIAVLRAEQITARYQVETGVWARRTKWVAFISTYLMNTWMSYQAVDLAGIVKHSVPPLLVFCVAETGPILRDRLTEAVLRAERDAVLNAAANLDTTTAPGVHDDPAAGLATDRGAVHGGTGERRSRTARGVRQSGGKPGRKLLADYLSEARAVWSPGVVVTPAWVRSVTDCARGTSKNVADALNREIETGALEVAA